MNFKKFYIIAAIALFGTLSFYIFGPSPEKPVVAITQIAPHPSLDEIRRGIMERLSQAGIKKVVFQNAQGNPAIALQIAQKFVSIGPKVIVPITTPSAQAAYSLAKPAKIPVIFSAVSDPLSAKLLPEGDALIAGVSDMPPIDEQVHLIKEILPSIKTIGVLYNGGEANSVSMIAIFIKKAKAAGIRVIEVSVNSTNNVPAGLASLIDKVDALYLPNDNTVVSAFDGIVTVANNNKLPIFASDPQSVARGALACIAYDQYAVGLKTGELIVDHLQKNIPLYKLGIQKPAQTEMILNLKAAKTLGIQIPKALMDKANFIIKN